MTSAITPEWIEQRSEPDLNTGCRLWAGAVFNRGYGKHGSKSAHRLSWAASFGPIPEGLHVLHRCDTRACVNPQHLFLGTHRDNMLDMVAKGRAAVTHRGEDHRFARLTERGVRAIRARRASGELMTRIAADLSVSKHTVRDVITGRTWSHVQ